MLACLYLVSILVDASQPARSPEAAYALLGAYVAFAALVTVLTWRNWWLDAKLAGPTHAVDIILFTLLVLFTQGYTSPFFTFFTFLLLSAAIRWNWDVTALSAILLVILYLFAGLVVADSIGHFELQRFLVRTGQLVILALILIWFGANKWRARFYRPDEELLGHPSLDESPVESGLRAAMGGLGAAAGVFVWRDRDRGEYNGIAVRGGQLAPVAVAGHALKPALASGVFLYDLARNRALKNDEQRNRTDFAASDAIRPETAARLGLGEGLAIPVRSADGEGQLFLESVRGLSTDHLDLGEQVAGDLAAHFQRHALLKAADENAESRSRLSLARDLHDSVVQFLAGAAFRIEALKRSAASGRDLEPELAELKELMLHEQRELRFFIEALRSGSLVALDDLAGDLKALAGRLGRQWDIDCSFAARPAAMMVPTRLHLDAHQLMREAVANAVRHAGAKSVSVSLAAEEGELRINFVNDGAEFRTRGGRPEVPESLMERVAQAGGTLDVGRGMGVTKVAIALPIGEAGA